MVLLCFPPFHPGDASSQFTQTEEFALIFYKTNGHQSTILPQVCICDVSPNSTSHFFFILVLTSIQSLLTDPNPNSPANMEAAKLFQENRREYDRRVLEITELSWWPHFHHKSVFSLILF